MSKLDTQKLIGAFIMVVAICVLVLSVVDIFNKVDYINEYNQCIEIYKQTYPQNSTLLNNCKESASNGLGFRIRTNQSNLSISQYTVTYLIIIIKVLLAIVFLIIGKVICDEDINKKEKKTTIKKIVKKPIKKSIKKQIRTKKKKKL